MLELRPWTTSDWPLAYQWFLKSWHQTSDDWTPRDLRGFVDQKLSQNAYLSGAWKNGNELVGLVVGYHINPITVQGHIQIKPSYWRSGIGIRVAKLALNWAWETGYRKVWVHVYPDNQQIIRVVQHLGAIDEGTLLSHTMRDGEPVNVRSFAILKPGDWGL